MFDPNLGRWPQQDPIDNPLDLQGWNQYKYAGDDPVDLADRLGTLPYPGNPCAFYSYRVRHHAYCAQVFNASLPPGVVPFVKWVVCMKAGTVGGSTPFNEFVNQFVYCSFAGGWKHPTQP